MNSSHLQRAYIGIVVGLGAAVLTFGLYTFTSNNLARLLAYIIVALASAGMKVKLPSVLGTLSINFVFLLIGIAELSLGETLLLGCLATLAQCIFHAKARPRVSQVLFSVASVEIALRAAYSFHHAPDLRSFVLTTTVFFISNTFLIALVIALTEGKNAVQVWKTSYFWSFPSYLTGAALAWFMAQANRIVGWEAALLLLPVLYVVYRSHRLYVENLEEATARAEQQRLHAEEVAALHRRTIEALALAIEAKDECTHDHLKRVEIYAVEVGKELGMGDIELQALRAAALLHDIGKIAIPEYIIAKPGKLTPEEFNIMKTHTVVGAELVERIQFPYSVAPLVRGHHEKWNGKGYPDGLVGVQIPLGARILAAVDCLDALASDRQYRRALPLSEAVGIIEAEAGASFDPEVVKVLVTRSAELELKARTEKGIQKLSLDIRIERGAAPAAGFAQLAKAASFDNEHSPNLEQLRSAPTERNRRQAELAAAIGHCSESESLFDTLRSLLPALVAFDAMVIYQRQGRTLVPYSSKTDIHGIFDSNIALGEGLSGWVAEHGMAIVNGNPSVESDYMKHSSRFDALESALSVPVSANDGVIGVLTLYRRECDSFTMGDLDTLTEAATALAGPLQMPPREALVGL